MPMLHILKLLVPALIPSWRFFDTIAPSPRIQFALLNTENDTPSEWREFRPRPGHLSFLQMLGRMIWNPEWNESLFLTSCAERLMENPTQHSEDEILKRIINELNDKNSNTQTGVTTHLQFRLLLVQRHNSHLHEEVTFYSRISPLSRQDLT